MKQFLSALTAFLATTATDAKLFELETTFTNEEEIFVGIELDNPVHLKLPRAKPPQDNLCLECTGWQLVDDSVTYTDFTIAPVVVGKRTKFMLTATGETNMDGELIEFENTCNVDVNGDSVETKSILVSVFPFRESE